MADIFRTQDLDMEDTSKVKTGNARRKYGKTKCGKGYKKVNGKCVKK
tara:strand:- start:309 stop:449 length:141 start_codon:yes stop_codon:yes gene_type:complete